MMNSYLIFALVLTVLYIIYYAVNIARDLYGKKGGGKSDEEVFDLGIEDLAEESIDVSENENGFSVGTDKYDTQAAVIVAAVPQEGDPVESGETAQRRFERLKAKAEARMEESVPYLSEGFTADDMYKAMCAGGHLDSRPELKWRPIKDML